MDFEQTLMLGHNFLVCTKWSKLTQIKDLAHYSPMRRSLTPPYNCTKKHYQTADMTIN